MVKSMMKFWSKKANDGEKVNQKKRAFTLVEILIVVAVIGILFVTLVPRIDFAGDKARETGVKTDFRSFELAAEQILRENAGLGDFAVTMVSTFILIKQFSLMIVHLNVLRKISGISLIPFSWQNQMMATLTTELLSLYQTVKTV